jgi:primary-amine oxidase
LVPGGQPALLAGAASAVARRAEFARHHLWVTQHSDGELHAAGDYPNQHPGGDGLPAFTAGNRSLDSADVVLWFTCGSNHVARPEDWPVMPVEHTGFHLRPIGFFDRNPALDVPPQDRIKPNGHCH